MAETNIKTIQLLCASLIRTEGSQVDFFVSPDFPFYKLPRFEFECTGELFDDRICLSCDVSVLIAMLLSDLEANGFTINTIPNKDEIRIKRRRASSKKTQK